MHHFLNDLEEKHASRMRSSYRGGKLETETRGCFYWWRLSFRCQVPKEQIEHEDTQDGEGHINIPGVVQESPLLETSLIVPANTLLEGVEHTLRGPFIDEMLIVDS